MAQGIGQTAALPIVDGALPSGGGREFAFVTALVDAIASFTTERVTCQPDAFVYRGADLRFAAERALYFRFVNQAALFDAFSACRSESAGAALLRDRLAQQLAAARPRAATGLMQSLRAARRFVRRDPVPDESRIANAPAVLAHVSHEKFVRYLGPVFERLPVPWAYLVAVPTAPLEYLQRHGVPCIESLDWDRQSGERVPDPLQGLRDLLESYDRFHSALVRLRPACMVLVEGNAPDDETMNQACASLGVPTLCIQQGWSPLVHNGFRNMSYTRMTVWGEGFAELLRPFNPRQTFVVTGSHQVFVAADGPRAWQRRGIGFFLQAPGALITAAAWSTFLDLIERTARELPSTPVIVREHPTRPLDEDERSALLKWPNLRLVPPGAESLGSTLATIGLAITIYSTVALESIAAGVVPLIVNLTSMPRYWPDVAVAGAGIEVRTANAATAIIRRIATDDDYLTSFAGGLDSFRAKYFASAPDAARQIAAQIEALARARAQPA